MAGSSPRQIERSEFMMRLSSKERSALKAIAKQHALSESEAVRRMIVATYQGAITLPASPLEVFNRQQ